MEFLKQVRENLSTEQGKQLRAERCVKVETVFGHLKYSMGFRRFYLRAWKR
jgi:hypothetical protein